MGCGSSSDTTRHHPQQQQQQQQQRHNPAVQPHPAAAVQPPYPAAVLVHPYPPTGQGAPVPQQAPYQHQQVNPPPVFPAAQQQDGSRGFRGHGDVPTDADGWEHYDPSAFGGGGGGHPVQAQGGPPRGGAGSEDEDAALAQAIARSLASAEEEQRQLRRAGVGIRAQSPPPPIPGRQHSAQVAFMTAPNEPFIDADLQLMPRVTYCAGGAEDDEGRQCALCFEEYADEPDAPLMLLPCFHRFHWKCAADWLKRKPECPVCKSNAKHTGASAIFC